MDWKYRALVWSDRLLARGLEVPERCKCLFLFFGEGLCRGLRVSQIWDTPCKGSFESWICKSHEFNLSPRLQDTNTPHLKRPACFHVNKPVSQNYMQARERLEIRIRSPSFISCPSRLFRISHSTIEPLRSIPPCLVTPIRSSSENLTLGPLTPSKASSGPLSVDILIIDVAQDSSIYNM